MAEFAAAWLRNLAPGEFGVLAAGLAVATLAAFRSIWRGLRRARMIEDTPTSRLRSAAQGYVELCGRGAPMAGPPVVAPLSGIPCLWYRYRVERRRDLLPAPGRVLWLTVREGVSDELFRIEDDTGACIVDPEGAEVTPTLRRRWYGGDDSPALVLGTRRHRTLGSFARFRYTEERLLPGPLYALGWFRTAANAQGDTGEEVAALLRRWKGDRAALLERFDRNGDGEIDLEEWSRAREAALREVLAARTEPAAEVHVLSRPADPRLPFLLAAGDRRTNARRYRVRARAAFAAFAAGTVALLWALIARLG